MNAIVNTVIASFPVRRMDFEFKETLRYWMDNEPCSTHIMDATSSLFPAGEMFFVKSVRAVRDLIKDNPQLQKDISAFIGQEAMHSKEHHAFHQNANAHGLALESLEQSTQNVIDFFINLLSKVVDEKQGSLAVTCALEHFTATFASHFMQRDDFTNRIQDPLMKKMWMWHATEESEHKAVAYDVYNTVYGRGASAYAVRALIMAGVMPVFFAVQFSFAGRLMARDKKLLNLRSWSKGVGLFWGRKGIFTGMMPEILDYFKPSFHPNDHDSAAILQYTQARLSKM